METLRTVPAAEQAAVPAVSNSITVWTQYSSFLQLRSLLTLFRNPASAGKTLSDLRKPRKQRSAFSNAFLRGVWVAEVTSEWNVEK